MSVVASRLYVVGSDDMPWVKIGISVDPQKRLMILQTGSPFTLSVLWHCEGDFTLEQHLHGVFGNHRIRGEWFDLTPLGDSVLAVQEAVQAAQGVLRIPSGPVRLPEPRACIDPEGCWGGICTCSALRGPLRLI
jgi:hypothetical protein